LTRRELLSDERFLSGLDADPLAAASAAEAGLARAVQRGTLLHVQVPGVEEAEDVYFVNTPRGRNAVRAVQAGRFVPGDRDYDCAGERATHIFARMSRQRPLSPKISDQLRAAARGVPAGFIEVSVPPGG